MRNLCDEPTSETGRGIRQEEVRGQADTSKSQRTRNMIAWLHGCVITLDDMVHDESEQVHYAFYVDTEPVNVTKALKNSK